MGEKETGESESERNGDSSKRDDTTESYSEPDFETLGSVVAIGELMSLGQQRGDGNGGNDPDGKPSQIPPNRGQG